MGNKTRIAAAAVSAVMALSVVPQAAFATNGDRNDVESYTKIASRLGGLDRAQTAAKIADAYRQRVDTVILTVGRNFPDALASTPLSDQLDAPVLLNDGASLNAPTSKWLFDNARKVKHVVVVGGTGVVPQSVLDDIKAVFQQAGQGAPSFVRYSGVDRNETAYQVSARTAAGYFAAGTCTSDGVSVTYSVNQRNAARDLRARDGELAEAQATLARYLEAKAAYEGARAAYDKSIDTHLAAEAALEAALEAQREVTEKLVVVGDIAALKAEVDRISILIAEASDTVNATRAMEELLNDILLEAVQPGAEPTEEDVWENLMRTPWTTVEAQLPGRAADIAKVRAYFGGASVGATVNLAEAKSFQDERNVRTHQEAFAVAMQAWRAAVEAQAGNDALLAELDAATRAVNEARAAEVAARSARDAAKIAYDQARVRYGWILLWNLGELEGEINRAQNRVNAAIDRVVAVADTVPVFLATGRDFADALSAGPAAADQCGVILLTENTAMSPAATKWVNAANPQHVVAVGGQARTAAGADATDEYVGKDRFDTAKKVNLRYLSDRDVVGIATGYDYPDALTGAGLVANADGGLLLVRTNEVPDYTREALAGGNWTKPVIFGGTAVVSPAVSTQINQILN